MKKLIILALTGAVLLSAQAIAFAGINIEVNGKQVPFDVNNGLGVPFVDENNRTLVPFRIAMEFAGATVDWNNETRTAIAMKNGIKVEAPIGKNYIYKDGVKETIDTQAVIKDGRTYLPIRAVLEALEYEISWEQETQTVVAETEEYILETVVEVEVPVVEKTIEELTVTESAVEITDFSGELGKVDFNITINVLKDLEPQYIEVYSYLELKVGTKLADQILSYVRLKKEWKKALPEDYSGGDPMAFDGTAKLEGKYWNWGSKKIQVISGINSPGITISGW